MPLPWQGNKLLQRAGTFHAVKQLNPETTFLQDFKSALAPGAQALLEPEASQKPLGPGCQGFHLEATGRLRVCDFSWTKCSTFRGPLPLRHWEVAGSVLRVRCQIGS